MTLSITNYNVNIDEYIINSLSEERAKSYKEYRSIFNEAAEMRSANSYPVHLDIELTNLCNYKCAFCVQGFDEKPEFYQKKKFLDFNLVIKILDEAKKIGVRSIQLNGQDEPTLSKDLLKIIQYASKLDFDDIYFNTNGSKLDPIFSKKLIESGLTKIQISIDAFSETTYLNIRKSTKYNQVVQNVLDLVNIRQNLNYKLPAIRVSFVESKDNAHETQNFISFWETKVDFVAIQKLLNIHKLINFNNKNDSNKICNMPNFRIMVKADGSTRPCCTQFGDELEDSGNIIDESLNNIWNSNKSKEFRNLHKQKEWFKNSVCNRCMQSL